MCNQARFHIKLIPEEIHKSKPALLYLGRLSKIACLGLIEWILGQRKPLKRRTITKPASYQRGEPTPNQFASKKNKIWSKSTSLKTISLET